MLKDELSAQSECVYILFKDVPVFACIQMVLDCLPVPATDKHPHSTMLPPPSFACSDGINQVMHGACFSPDKLLAVLPKEFSLHLTRPENLFPHAALMSLYPVLCLLFNNTGFCLATLPWRPDLWSAAETVLRLSGSSIAVQDFGAVLD